MATINSINSNIPIEISKGGTNNTTFTNYAVIYYDGSKIATVASAGTSGQILTSNGAGSAPTYQDGPSGLSVAFYGYLSTDTAYNKTGDGTIYTLAFDSERFDLGSDFNTSTGTFTAPSTAYYLMSGCPMYAVTSTVTDTGNTATNTFLVAPGVGSVKDHYRGRPEPMDSSTPQTAGTAADGYWGQSISAIFSLTAADTVVIWQDYESTAIGKTVGAGANNNGSRSVFSGWLLGT